MPSTRLLNVKIKSLPCFEQEGMIWIWPGDDPPTATLPCLLPPSGFEIHAEVFYKGILICSDNCVCRKYVSHASMVLWTWCTFSYLMFVKWQIVMELPIEHGLLLDNLLDLAHAPFTHTSTFAKGWSVPRWVILMIFTSVYELENFERFSLSGASGLFQDYFNYFHLKIILLNLLFLVYFLYDMNSQLGEIFDACIRPPRILGPLSNRYGISTTMYGAINHWHLKAWKIGGTEYPAVRNTSSPTSCLLTFVNKENKVTIPNVTWFCPRAEAHSFHAISMEAFCRTGKNFNQHMLWAS